MEEEEKEYSLCVQERIKRKIAERGVTAAPSYRLKKNIEETSVSIARSRRRVKDKLRSSANEVCNHLRSAIVRKAEREAMKAYLERHDKNIQDALGYAYAEGKSIGMLVGMAEAEQREQQAERFEREIKQQMMQREREMTQPAAQWERQLAQRSRQMVQREQQRERELKQWERELKQRERQLKQREQREIPMPIVNRPINIPVSELANAQIPEDIERVQMILNRHQ